MKTIALIICIFMVGCASSYNDILKDIPEAGFDEFETGIKIPGYSNNLKATEASIKDGILHIGSVEFQGGYSFFRLKNYHRQLNDPDIKDTPPKQPTEVIITEPQFKELTK